MPRTGDCPCCTRPAPSAHSRTQNAGDTLAGTSAVTTSIGGVANDTVMVVGDAAWSASSTFSALCGITMRPCKLQRAHRAANLCAHSAGDGAGRRAGIQYVRAAQSAAPEVRMGRLQLSRARHALQCHAVGRLCSQVAPQEGRCEPPRWLLLAFFRCLDAHSFRGARARWRARAGTRRHQRSARAPRPRDVCTCTKIGISSPRSYIGPTVRRWS